MTDGWIVYSGDGKKLYFLPNPPGLNGGWSAPLLKDGKLCANEVSGPNHKLYNLDEMADMAAKTKKPESNSQLSNR